MKKIILMLCLLGLAVPLYAKLRNRTYRDRVARAPYHHAEPCCNRRNYFMPETSAGAVAEVRRLRNNQWNQLDDGTYQDDWQWTQNRIREIETRLGYIVDWQD